MMLDKLKTFSKNGLKYLAYIGILRPQAMLRGLGPLYQLVCRHVLLVCMTVELTMRDYDL